LRLRFRSTRPADLTQFKLKSQWLKKLLQLLRIKKFMLILRANRVLGRETMMTSLSCQKLENRS
jgi:hypothetical protein